MSKYLTISLIIIGIISGIGIGYLISPQYKYNSMMERDMEAMDLGEPGRLFDLNYINKMAAHHRGAILLAEQVKDKSKREEIRNLANEIIKNEPVLIEELNTWKKDWYKDSSQVKDNVIINLGEYDENLDLRFLNALIAHHELGVEMAEEAKTKSTRNEVLNNAFIVSKFLTDSGNSLKEWRKDWYNINY